MLGIHLLGSALRKHSMNPWSKALESLEEKGGEKDQNKKKGQGQVLATNSNNLVLNTRQIKFLEMPIHDFSI